MSSEVGTSERHVASACPLDCPDACSLDVTVAEGRVVAIGGSHVNPVTHGLHLRQGARVPAPHVRRGAAAPARPSRRAEGRRTFPARVSWDEALALVSRKLLEVRSRSGGEAILPFSYGGSNGYLSQGTTDARLFRRLGASRLARTVCAAPSAAANAALYGKMTGIAYPDYADARLIVLWGVNPSVSGIHLVPYIQEAQKKGARLVVVDPRRTRLAERADLHLAPHPGTDLPLALAVIRWIFAEGRADREFLEAHATGAEELERRAARWTLERAAAETRIPAADIESLRAALRGLEPGRAALRLGAGAEPQRGLGDGRDPRPSRGGRKVRRAGRRLHDVQLVGLAGRGRRGSGGRRRAAHARDQHEPPRGALSRCAVRADRGSSSCTTATR